MKPGTARYFARGSSARPDEDDDVVPGSHRRAVKKLRPHDLLLKQFSYRDALDAALETREPSSVASVLEELAQRGDGALGIALRGRDEAELEPVLAFLTRFVTHPRFAAVLAPVCEAVLEAYADDVGRSIVVDTLVEKLDIQVRNEVDVQMGLHKFLGKLDVCLGGA